MSADVTPRAGDSPCARRSRRSTRPAPTSRNAALFCRRPLVIGAADSPVHAPAPAAGGAPAEKVLERGPPVRRERPDRKLQARFTGGHAAPSLRPARRHAASCATLGHSGQGATGGGPGG